MCNFAPSSDFLSTFSLLLFLSIFFKLTLSPSSTARPPRPCLLFAQSTPSTFFWVFSFFFNFFYPSSFLVKLFYLNAKFAHSYSYSYVYLHRYTEIHDRGQICLPRGQIGLNTLPKTEGLSPPFVFWNSDNKLNVLTNEKQCQMYDLLYTSANKS